MLAMPLTRHIGTHTKGFKPRAAANQTARSANLNQASHELQGGPYITANLYCICLSEHETCT